MLCLDEGTPIIMALILLGSVLLIVGGSLWGNGNMQVDRSKEIAGIVLFSVSLLFLLLSGLGCWCNRFFCTPDRKSRIALRLYRAQPPMTGGGGGGGGEDGEEVVEDKDWAEYAGSDSAYRSFRSSRNSTRKLRSRVSFRRDRIAPNSDAPQLQGESLSEVHQWQTSRQQQITPVVDTMAGQQNHHHHHHHNHHQQQPNPPPPPLPPRSLPHPNNVTSDVYNGGGGGGGNGVLAVNGRVQVPVEYSDATTLSYRVGNSGSYTGYLAQQSQTHHRQQQQKQSQLTQNLQPPEYSQQPQPQYRHPQQSHQAPLSVRPHMGVSVDTTAIVSDSVLV